jgi:hypothetical protein
MVTNEFELHCAHVDGQRDFHDSIEGQLAIHGVLTLG